ncbi:prolipoprotein diacylglyceryl transferase [Erythrobacter sp. 3-20A1M]|uniref:prolipoprotein diacylglyceryl transferase n=1 Tax=Erythrobacter sp. 3-20A1M TaxID=2653850 RepID=UPI001BFC112B|nr:prolipoprotein diacylglyceryl transferase [Erythrobacter sp. 3-20A1M]QWC56575.1 prolipoprotein diacylglyceryl transferase [Erythrobacter sp. 3-20A1M]
MLSLLAGAVAQHPIYWADLGLRPGIDLGFFTLRFYSLAYIAGIVLGYWHLSKMVKAPGAPMAQRHAEDLFFYCTLGIILGGRLGFALFYRPELFTDFSHSGWMPWGLLRLWDGGMSFHGGVLGVLAAIAFVSWRGQLNWIRVCDYIAVNVPFGMFFGRIANFINGELYGRPTDVPWAMIFPTDPLQVPRHPSQLYQAALEGLVPAIVLLCVFWYTKARWRPGLLVGLFTVFVAGARFINEFFRAPDSYLAYVVTETGLSRGQWLSIPMILVGLAIMAWSLWRRPTVTKPVGDTRLDA